MFDWRNGRTGARAVLILAAIAATACSEKLEEGGACGTLCPAPQIVITDTVLTPVDTGVTVGGYNANGVESRLLLATRPSDLDVRAVIRFDTLPQRAIVKSGDTTTAVISYADSTLLHLRLDLTSSVIRSAVTIEAFDVDDGAVSDTAIGRALPFFTTSRLIGTRTLQRTELLDTISLRLSDAAIVAKASMGKRFRVGLRVTSDAQTELRFISTESGSGLGTAPFLTFRTSPDTVLKATSVAAIDRDSLSAASTVFDRADYTIFVRGQTAPSSSASVIEVGGLPGRRGYLRFVLPPLFSDSTVTIVRAQLELTQLPSSALPDTVTIFPVASLAGRAVSDPQRAAGLIDVGSLGGGAFPLDSLVLAPRDSGTHSVNVLRVVRFWTSATEKKNPHALVLRTRYENTNPGLVRFFTGSPSVPLAARPRLVLSFVKRVPFNLP